MRGILTYGEEGGDPDKPLCSRNARPKKTLVGRGQWELTQATPSEKRNKQAWKGNCIAGHTQPKVRLVTPIKK